MSNFTFQNIKCSINIFEMHNKYIMKISYSMNFFFKKMWEIYIYEKEFLIYPIFLLYRYLVQMLWFMWTIILNFFTFFIFLQLFFILIEYLLFKNLEYVTGFRLSRILIIQSLDHLEFTSLGILINLNCYRKLFSIKRYLKNALDYLIIIFAVNAGTLTKNNSLKILFINVFTFLF